MKKGFYSAISEVKSSINKLIRKFKPDVLLHGHIHEAAGADEKIGRTRIINTGPEGIILEI